MPERSGIFSGVQKKRRNVRFTGENHLKMRESLCLKLWRFFFFA
jgi:hypothetical protein